jgi:short-subunit dehydrogenase
MKTIVIIGASRGIGKELAIQASNAGHQVIALARSKDKLAQLQSQCPSINIAVLDLESKNVKADLGVVLNDVALVDYLINNAGILVNKPFKELTREDFESSYQVNLIGIMLATQVVLEKMNKGAHVVNISSMGGFQGTMKFPGLAAYSSSKAAIASITELLAEEYKEEGISFNCLALGAVQTEMLEEAFPGYEAPLKPNEMAKYILDFTFNGSQFFNGKILPVSSTTP